MDEYDDWRNVTLSHNGYFSLSISQHIAWELPASKCSIPECCPVWCTCLRGNYHIIQSMHKNRLLLAIFFTNWHVHPGYKPVYWSLDSDFTICPIFQWNWQYNCSPAVHPSSFYRSEVWRKHSIMLTLCISREAGRRNVYVIIEEIALWQAV